MSLMTLVGRFMILVISIFLECLVMILVIFIYFSRVLGWFQEPHVFTSSFRGPFVGMACSTNRKGCNFRLDLGTLLSEIL